MITAWRISAAKYNKEQTFSGEGGLYVAGRWNYKGQLAVYVSDSLALATLEIYVRRSRLVKEKAHKAYRIEIPENLIETKCLTPDVLAAVKNDDFAFSQNLGSHWLNNLSGCPALKIPSAIVPEEFNFLLNPRHPDFNKIILHDPIDQYFDPRL